MHVVTVILEELLDQDIISRDNEMQDVCTDTEARMPANVEPLTRDRGFRRFLGTACLPTLFVGVLIDND